MSVWSVNSIGSHSVRTRWMYVYFVVRIGLRMVLWTETCHQVYNIDNKLLHHCKHNGTAPIKTDYVCWTARGIVLFFFINWPQEMNFSDRFIMHDETWCCEHHWKQNHNMQCKTSVLPQPERHTCRKPN